MGSNLYQPFFLIPFEVPQVEARGYLLGLQNFSHLGHGIVHDFVLYIEDHGSPTTYIVLRPLRQTWSVGISGSCESRPSRTR
jgi:hypothetical protein